MGVGSKLDSRRCVQENFTSHFLPAWKTLMSIVIYPLLEWLLHCLRCSSHDALFAVPKESLWFEDHLSHLQSHRTQQDMTFTFAERRLFVHKNRTTEEWSIE